MSRYYQKPEKTRREKIGFYTAFSICLIAVCMAVYSTYTTVRQPKRQTAASVTPTSAVSVAQPMTGVTVPAATEPPETEPEVSAAPDTTAAAETTAATEPTGETRHADALQTMLAAEISLTMPTKSGRVVKPYSSDSVYNKTLNSWKPHTGADFDGELGDDVYAMLGGDVVRIYDDAMLGKCAEVAVNNVVIGYCGLGAVSVKAGDHVERGDKLGTVGAVPSEADAPNHIHVTVKINGAYADPLSFIGNGD